MRRTTEPYFFLIEQQTPAKAMDLLNQPPLSSPTILYDLAFVDGIMPMNDEGGSRR